MKTLTKVLKATAPSSTAGLMKGLVLSMFFISLLFLTSCANLIEATKKGDTASAMKLIHKGADVNKKDKDDYTALMRASWNGHTDIVKALLEKGADVNVKDKDGWTALMKASWEGHTEIAKALIAKGADVNAINKQGETALMLATRNGHTEIAKALIEKGADVKAKNKWGETTLMLAVEKGHTQSAFNLPQTHQAKSYATGDDGDLRRGVAWPNPRFTIDKTGDCVTDNLTGLMWVRNPNSAKRNWQDALDYTNGLNLCGYEDWHLPNIKELRSLINYGQADIATWLKGRGFKNIQTGFYWSSSTGAFFTFQAVGINLGSYMSGPPGFRLVVDGEAMENNKNGRFYVWPVRAGVGGAYTNLAKTGQTKSYAAGDDGDLKKGVAWPNPSKTGDCVTDNLTGLMWVKNPDRAKVKWQQALDNANNLTLCGYSDWRLPNVNELESLIAASSRASLSKTTLPSGHPFKNVEGHLYTSDFIYWTASTYSDSTDSAWFIHIGEGFVSAFHKQIGKIRVWPVRAGQ